MKVFFDSLVFLGVLLFIVKFIILVLNYFAFINFAIPDGLPKVLSTVIPLALIIIGSVGSGRIKMK